MRITKVTASTLTKLTLETLSSTKCKDLNNDLVSLEKYKNAFETFKSGKTAVFKFGHPLPKEEDKLMNELKYQYGLNYYQCMICIFKLRIEKKQLLIKRMNEIRDEFNIKLGSDIRLDINEEDLQYLLNIIRDEELTICKRNKDVLVELSQYGDAYIKYREFIMKQYQYDLKNKKTTEKAIYEELAKHNLLESTPYEKNEIVKFIREFCNKRINTEVMISANLAPIQIDNPTRELSGNDMYIIKQFVYYLTDLKMDMRSRMEKLDDYKIDASTFEEEDFKLLPFYDPAMLIDNYMEKKKTK